MPMRYGCALQEMGVGLQPLLKSCDFELYEAVITRL